jgi:hypothetical protein
MAHEVCELLVVPAGDPANDVSGDAARTSTSA